jgi:two-component system, OmpR family, sensor histidine kinase KdpD
MPPRPVDVDGDGLIGRDELVVALRASAYAAEVELRVVDHGRGPAEEGRRSGVHPVPAARRPGRHQRGGGLGLAVAKGFIDAMGGTIRTAEDTPGGGLTIVISLP